MRDVGLQARHSHRACHHTHTLARSWLATPDSTLTVTHLATPRLATRRASPHYIATPRQAALALYTFAKRSPSGSTDG